MVARWMGWDYDKYFEIKYSPLNIYSFKTYFFVVAVAPVDTLPGEIYAWISSALEGCSYVCFTGAVADSVILCSLNIL